MVQIPIAVIERAVAQSREAERELRQAAANRAKQIFDDSMIGLKKEFEDNPVTREIDEGVNASNISGTLGGEPATKNLYSFIGFPANDPKPTNPIREILNSQHPNGPKLGPPVPVPDKLPKYSFTIDVNPVKQAIFKNTPMPWGEGLSWAELVETRIPGFAQFLNRPTKSPKPSRSGGGIQTDHDVRVDTYAAPEAGYINRMLSNFINNIKTFKRRRFS